MVKGRQFPFELLTLNECVILNLTFKQVEFFSLFYYAQYIKGILDSF
jgi:hypothetical protein